MDEQDPKRHQMHKPIPARPADPAAAGDADKVVGPPQTVKPTPDLPPLDNQGLASGPAIDHVGGPGCAAAEIKAAASTAA
jgi:hypothetical protein